MPYRRILSARHADEREVIDKRGFFQKRDKRGNEADQCAAEVAEHIRHGVDDSVAARIVHDERTVRKLSDKAVLPTLVVHAEHGVSRVLEQLPEIPDGKRDQKRGNDGYDGAACGGVGGVRVWCGVVWRCSFGGKPFFRKRTVFPRPPFPKKLSLSYTLFYCYFISRTGYILFRQNNLHRFISF